MTRKLLLSILALFLSVPVHAGLWDMAEVRRQVLDVEKVGTTRKAPLATVVG